MGLRHFNNIQILSKNFFLDRMVSVANFYGYIFHQKKAKKINNQKLKLCRVV